MIKCDICGAKAPYLDRLQDVYATEDIKELCSDCFIDVNKQLKDIQEITFRMNHHWLKKFIINLKAKIVSD